MLPFGLIFKLFNSYPTTLIEIADIAFIMSSSQDIVNWLNALDQSDFS